MGICLSLLPAPTVHDGYVLRTPEGEIHVPPGHGLPPEASWRDRAWAWRNRRRILDQRDRSRVLRRHPTGPSIRSQARRRDTPKTIDPATGRPIATVYDYRRREPVVMIEWTPGYWDRRDGVWHRWGGQIFDR